MYAKGQKVIITVPQYYPAQSQLKHHSVCLITFNGLPVARV